MKLPGRFYSSTGYFSVAPAVTGEWHELSLSSWELLEDQLRERFDSVLSALQRRAPHTRYDTLCCPVW